ncbi:MAG: MarC family protein [Caldivirga sp.]|jgi:multiple antibiotic resistance protein|uniref:MarC family protein n=1 Tax=Caldivirga sp. MU80 TaxID=1650354 RepID=UPI0007492353|nr:MarC family protein [Caldivirga sp. MU80]KUO88050.1 MAG: antibiotic resistance protein MarC [Caldivirga sp. CIS_19]
MQPFSIFDALVASVQLYAIIDPLGAIPLLVNVPNYENLMDRFLKLVALTVPTLLLLFAFAGPFILSIFSINIDDFRVAGGVILLIIAVDVLREGTPRTMGINPEEYIIVPIITPMLVGPGAITSVMVMVTYYNELSVLTAILVASLATYLTMRYSIYLVRLIGNNTLRIFARFFSIIIASWAVQLIALGILGIVKAA